jgi:hypothetical protein
MRLNKVILHFDNCDHKFEEATAAVSVRKNAGVQLAECPDHAEESAERSVLKL